MKIEIRSSLGVVVLLCLVLVLQGGCNKKKSTTSNQKPRLVKTLVDEHLTGGYECVWWFQDDDQGSFVTPGIYKAHMTANGFDTTAQFEIREGATHVPPYPCYDVLGGPPPEMFSLSLSPTYAPRDTVTLYFTLPKEARVRIDIER